MDRPYLLDARWVAKGGTGTVTRSLLAGLGDVGAEGWTVWGPPSLAPLVWPAARLEPTDIDPVAWFGQRCALRVPRADLVLHPHQTRPLHRSPTASIVLDLIQRQEPSRALRLAKTARLRAVVRAARVVFTISESVRAEIVDRYGLAEEDITVLRLPVDGEAVARIQAHRPEQDVTPPYVVAVGRFAPHKNLARLVAGFSRTRFAAGGGRLHLVGGDEAELALDGALPTGVSVRGVLPPEGLERELAGATALVQASLHEGYGLPVAEALAARVPVVSSPIPAAVEDGPLGLPTFDPLSVPAITDALDDTVELVTADRYWDQVGWEAWAASRPTPTTLARQVLDRLEVAR